MMRRIHITGASGSGTTTLGRALAERLGWEVLDADDFFWEPTEPPYQTKRAKDERLARVHAAVDGRERIILSGSICGWEEALEHAFDLVIFLTARQEVRMERLRKRELQKLGRVDEAFMAWAAQYDHGGLMMRSRAMHEQWLAARKCPVLRLDGEREVRELVEEVLGRKVMKDEVVSDRDK